MVTIGRWLCAGLVASALSVDGLLRAVVVLAILSLGGYLNLLWPGFAWTCLIVTMGCLAFIVILVFIVLPVMMIDDDDGSYPGS